MSGPFLTFWQDHGGVPIFGYPISPEMPEVSTGGRPRTLPVRVPCHVRLGTLSPKSTLRRGYAIVRKDGAVAASVAVGDRVDVELAESGFGARVEDVR